jgi:hypothetical protein
MALGFVGLAGEPQVIHAIVMVPGGVAGEAFGLSRDSLMTVSARQCRQSRRSAALPRY